MSSSCCSNRIKQNSYGKHDLSTNTHTLVLSFLSYQEDTLKPTHRGQKKDNGTGLRDVRHIPKLEWTCQASSKLNQWWWSLDMPMENPAMLGMEIGILGFLSQLACFHGFAFHFSSVYLVTLPKGH